MNITYGKIQNVIYLNDKLSSEHFTKSIGKKIAQEIARSRTCDRDRIAHVFQIAIGIAIAIAISDEDRDRDRDLNFGDRGHALRLFMYRYAL